MLVPLTIYSVLVAFAATHQRDQINPDAVNYLRNALYLAEGRGGDSVSGYWSPLISWLIAPLLYLQVDSLIAARIVLACSGALLIAASTAFLRKLAEPTPATQILVGTLISISAVFLATNVISPDIILAACLIAYCTFVVSPDLLESRKTPLLCGLFGGISYLAKAYGFPFFLAHFSFSVALRWLFRRQEVSIRSAAAAWGLGLLVFGAVSAPWIGVLSSKYDRLTYSTTAEIIYALNGPGWKTPEQAKKQLHPAIEGRIYVGEVIDTLYLDAPSWSPLESRENLLYQLTYSIDNGRRIINDLSAFDLLGITLVALVFFPLIALGQARRETFPAFWMLGTAAIFCAPFLLVYYEVRYIEAFLWPLCCAYCVAIVVPAVRELTARGRMAGILGSVAVGLAALSFAGGAALRIVPRLGNADSVYRDVANALRSDGVVGPIAAGDSTIQFGLYVSYFLDQPYLGVPGEETVTEVEAALGRHGARTFLVQSDWPLAEAFRQQTSWRSKRVIQRRGGTTAVYEAPNG
ncbi:MAG: ArnT family glycosyltransferase [Myxococcota bacterium]